jgi:hypothetical protein
MTAPDDRPPAAQRATELSLHDTLVLAGMKEFGDHYRMVVTQPGIALPLGSGTRGGSSRGKRPGDYRPVGSTQAHEFQRSLQEVGGRSGIGAGGGPCAAAIATFGRPPARGQNDEGSLTASHQAQGAGLLLQVVGVLQAPDSFGQGPVRGPDLVQVGLQAPYPLALFEQAASGLDRHGPGESDHEEDGYDLGAGPEPRSEPEKECSHLNDRANALVPA